MRHTILVIFLYLSLFGADINYSNNYKRALSDAKKENKLVYMLITSQTCRWCKKFEKTTLQDENIKKRLYSEFIPVHLCRDKDFIPLKFKTAPVPRHYFVDSYGNILYAALGYRDVELFDSFMDNAQNKYNKK